MSKTSIPARSALKGVSKGAGSPQQMRAEGLDPEAVALLNLLNLADVSRITHANLRRKRMAWCLSAKALGRGTTMVQVEALRIPGPAASIDLRLYHPAPQTTPAPAFLWFHGGGFLMGGFDSADAICRRLALTSGAVVITARYRLAPENDLYAGREDCMAVLDWVTREGLAHGIDATRLAVGGDSAGGNLAAALSQRAVERGGPPLRLQALVYPATNLRDDFPSKTENACGYLLTSDGIDAIKSLITEELPNMADPWLSPGLRPDLKGLPPALILTAGFDPIRDDGLAYAERLREAGVPVELLHYAGQFHGFLNFDGVLWAARDALERIGAALRHALMDTPDGTAPEMSDRTLEIAARSRSADAWPGLGAGRSLVVAGFMLGERLEGWRTDALCRMLPTDSLLAGLAASKWLNPITACRAKMTHSFTAIEVRETYDAADTTKGARQLGTEVLPGE